MNRRVVNIFALLIFPLGFAFGQNGAGGAQPANAGGKLPGNVKPVSKTKGVNESKPTALPSNVKPVDKSKSSGTKPTIAPMPKTAIKNKQ
jgi:hypothetical protein